MPRNGSGTYSKPANTDAVSGQTIESAKFNELTDDFESALTASLAKDGQTPLTGNLNANSNKITGLAAATTAGDALRYEQGVKIAGDTMTGELVLPAAGPASTLAAGYKGAPQNEKNEDYTFVLADAGKHIYHSESTTARTYTIPANGSVAFPIGTVITIVNGDGAGDITLAITDDTLRRGDGIDATGSRTIAENSMASVVKVASTLWYISGSYT